MAEVQSIERISEKVVKTVDQLIERVAYLPASDQEAIRKAYEFSEKAHSGQIRKSGEPYILHPLGVAAILGDLRLDGATVITGLLHDTVEDTQATLEDVQKQFGAEVAALVDGVTKISQIQFRNTHEKQGENIRKMIVAMGKDIRVVLVKLADRLHNMRTLNHMPYHKQTAIAQETLDIYSPLANRLGINPLKIELEDLSFRYLRPDLYYELAQKIAKKKTEREKYIDEVKKILNDEVQISQITCDIQGRSKHIYSIYKKMEVRSLDFDQIYDLLAFRIIVDSVARCYEVLGIVHSLWKPIPGRFKDFIAMPKANNYQSLHTSVFGPGAERIEIQIRTKDMNLIAERGVAAHWGYKEKREVDQQTEQRVQWLRDLIASYQQLKDPDEFLENIKGDLFESEIYVFTPKGEVRALPEGSTTLDFAYSIHTGVGSKTVGAKVNGRMVPLKHVLKSGDTVEIITGANQTPSKDWLKFCVTSRAQSKIRTYVRSQEREKGIELGKEMLEKEFRKHGFSPSRFLDGPAYQKFLKEHGMPDEADLYLQVGYGKILPNTVSRALIPEENMKTEVKEEPKTFLAKVFQAAKDRTRKSRSVIRVDGLADVLVRYGKCCNPIPGDPIVGFISLGRGVTVHHAGCPRGFAMDEGRRVDVEWSTDTDVVRTVKMRVTGSDSPGLLKNLSSVFTGNGVNILNADVRTTKDQKAVCVFEVQVRDVSQLQKLIQDVQKLKGIIAVERISQA